MPDFSKYTDRARKVLRLADTAAKRRGHRVVGTEHILLGIAEEWGGVASGVLKGMGILPEAIIAATDHFLGPTNGVEFEFKTNLPMTQRSEKVCDLALQSACNLSHSYVGTEHLVVGLLREGSGVGGAVLKNMGVELQDFIERMKMLVSGEVFSADWVGVDLKSEAYAPTKPELALHEALEAVIKAKEALGRAKAEEVKAWEDQERTMAIANNQRMIVRASTESYHAARKAMDDLIEKFGSAVNADPA